MKKIERFSQFIETKTGLFFDETRKRYLIQAIKKRMLQRKITIEDEYYQLLNHPILGQEELTALTKFITIAETRFFRHPEQFEAFKIYLLPKLIEKNKKRGENTLKIWSAGCSSGEEPYTIAMVLAVSKNQLETFSVEIYATDINQDLLKKAKSGIYNAKSISHLPKRYQKYFVCQGEHCLVKEEIKNMVKFFELNLIKEPFPLYILNELDVIFCRNVFIYFREESVKRVLRNFYLCLKDDGYLILAPTESLIINSKTFVTEKIGGTFFYRKAKFKFKSPFHIPKPSVSLSKKTSTPKVSSKTIFKKKTPPFKPDNLKTALKEARLYADAGLYDRTIEICHQVLNHHPTLPEAYLILGIVYYGTGAIEKAIANFKKAIYLAPDFALAHFYLGNVYWHLNKMSEAIRSYKNVVKSLQKTPYCGILPEIMDVIPEKELRQICSEYIKT
ncbi:MAG: tetratricopeptide repeat protein [Candidatus Desulfofervidaceae bacterium]|nr:tetratricopeptide repeat protein [Candidatus Desulfofervidaceae bacterium]